MKTSGSRAALALAKNTFRSHSAHSSLFKLQVRLDCLIECLLDPRIELCPKLPSHLEWRICPQCYAERI